MTEKGEERPKTKNKKSTVILPEPEVVNKEKKKSSKMSEKPNSNVGTDKSYEDFSPILDGYADLLDHLNPEESEVDKVVKFILDKNIMVRHVNILLSHLSTPCCGDFKEILKVFKKLKSGRFTRGKFGEDAFLLRRWDELVRDVPIKHPQNLISQLLRIEPKEKLVLKRQKGLKRNVIGCFLGQDLEEVRHAADVFRRTCILLSSSTFGKFGKEEDEIILREVENSGRSLETWKKIGHMLNRTNLHSISRRHRLLTTDKTAVVGRWTLAENEILLENIFGDQRNAGVQKIRSVRYNDLDLIAVELNRPKPNVWNYWNKVIRPILLSYHSGTLHKLWCVEFFRYLIQKKVVGRQNINFSEALTLFPEQTGDSLHHVLRNFRNNQENKEQPLYQVPML